MRLPANAAASCGARASALVHARVAAGGSGRHLLPANLRAQEHEGIVEFLVSLECEVRAGDPIARVHNFSRPSEPPHEYRAGCDGLLVSRHYPGLVGHGDCLAVIGSDYAGG